MQDKVLLMPDGEVIAASASGQKSTFVNPELIKGSGSDEKNDWANWGANNKLPLEIRNVTLQNHIAPALLDFKISATVGKGILTYREVPEGNKVRKEIISLPEVDEFLLNNGYHEEDMTQLLEMSTDVHWWEQLFVEFIPSAGGKIVEINHLDCIYTRSGKRDPKTKKVKAVYFAEEFGDLDSRKSARPKAIRYYQKDKQMNSAFALHIKKPTPGAIYYPPAVWHSSEMWMRHGISIPAWKASGMKNAANLKYHVEIPETYMISLYPKGRYSDEQREKAKAELIQMINEFLVGEENAQKTVTTFYGIDPITGKEMPGIKITVLEDKSNYDAYLEDDERVTAALCSAHNVNPALANILLRNSLSGQSGNQLRYAFDLWTQLYAYIPRQLILQPLYLVKRLNGWPADLKFGFKDLKLETLDENPTGSTNAI